jgi:hypothetical protein
VTFFYFFSTGLGPAINHKCLKVQSKDLKNSILVYNTAEHKDEKIKLKPRYKEYYR